VPAPYVLFVFFWGGAIGADAGRRSAAADALQKPREKQHLHQRQEWRID
jgi:hypothetical protein